MLASFVSLLALATMILAAYGLGRPVVRALRVAEEDPLDSTVWSLAVGAIAAGMILTMLGLVGALHAAWIGVGSLAAAFWGAGELLRQRLSGNRTPGGVPVGELVWSDTNENGEPAGPPRWLLRTLLGLAALGCLGSLAGALAPPTAGDALCYHLDLPKRFLAAHEILFLPYNDNVTYPLLTEMWYLWGLALEGPVAAQLVHWAMGVLFALATVVLARPILGHRWAWLAGAVVVLTPGVTNQMTAPLSDVALAAMTTLALAGWWRGCVGQEDRRWFVLAGLAGGAALGIKYVAILFAAAVGATWAWNLLRQPPERRRLLGGAAVVLIVATSTGGVWYVRAAWHHANPVYPFFSDWAAADASAGASLETLPARKAPLGRGAAGLLAAPWQVTMHPERFGGRGHQLGVLYLALLPGLALARRLRGLGTLLAVAGVYVLIWYLLRQNVRFLFPILACLAVAVVWVAMETRRMPALPGRLAAAASLGILLVFAAVAVERTRDRWAVAAGLERRGDYLARCEPSHVAASVARLLAEPDAHLLTQECRTFYFDGPVTRESIFRRLTGYDRQVREPGDLSRVLRAAGFTHLLLAESLDDRAPFDPTLARLADADPSVECLAAFTARTPQLGARRYRFVRLGGTRRR